MEIRSDDGWSKCHNDWPPETRRVYRKRAATERQFRGLTSRLCAFVFPSLSFPLLLLSFPPLPMYSRQKRCLGVHRNDGSCSMNQPVRIPPPAHHSTIEATDTQSGCAPRYAHFKEFFSIILHPSCNYPHFFCTISDTKGGSNTLVALSCRHADHGKEHLAHAHVPLPELRAPRLTYGSSHTPLRSQYYIVGKASAHTTQANLHCLPNSKV